MTPSSVDFSIVFCLGNDTEMGVGVRQLWEAEGQQMTGPAACLSTASTATYKGQYVSSLLGAEATHCSDFA